MRNEMTKQEAIQKAYEAAGVEWDKFKIFVNKDGWIDTSKESMGNNLFKEILSPISEMDEKVTLLFRPKSLSGIETNNGWTRIESEADLPTDEFSDYIGGKLTESNLITRSPLDYKDVLSMHDAGLITHWRKKEVYRAPIY